MTRRRKIYPKPLNAAPPVILLAPVITEPIIVGTPAAFTSASASGTAVLYGTFRWRIDGVDVGSADTAYTPVAGDAGKALTVRQRIYNAWGEVYSTSAAVTVPLEGSLRWSNPATWGGTLPIAGEAVVINSPIIWDVASTPALASLTIASGGTLRADPTMDVGLTAGFALVESGGAWHITGASLVTPYAHTATITIDGARSTHTARPSSQGFTNSGAARAINNHGTRIWLGSPKTVHLTKLSATANLGVTSITVKDSVTDWKAGERIAIAPTNFYGQSVTEVVTLTADGVSAGGGNYTLTFTPALSEKHFGVLQYPIDAAYGTQSMSLTPGTFTSPHASCPTVLDERAEVINLSAGNILVQAPADSAWSTQGWGVHVMDHYGSVFKDDAVRVRRGGQRGALGRYPFHSHMMSYNAGTGAFVSDRTDCHRRFCVVDQSENRAFTTHGTCGSVMMDCVSHDVKGHAFFNEDGSEVRNDFRRNFALKVRNPAAGDHLKRFDGDDASGNASSSGHWWSNMNNTFIDNMAADCQGYAIWENLATQCFGDSALVALNPNTTNLLTWTGNGGHSNGFHGMALAFTVSDDLGNLGGNNWTPPAAPLKTGGVAWKNNRGGYTNGVSGSPTYTGWTVADNGGADFEGTTSGGLSNAHLFVGTSLNDVGTYPSSDARFGFATYHYTLLFKDSAFQNFPWATGVRKNGGQQDSGGGAFNARDLYTLPVFGQQAYNTGLRLNNSHMGFVSRSPALDSMAVTVTIASPAVVTWPLTHGFDVNQLFVFPSTTGALPTGLVVGTTYYIRNPSGATFQLALTSGGASINTSGTQSGVHQGTSIEREGSSAPNNKRYWTLRGAMPDPERYYGSGATGSTPRYVVQGTAFLTDGAADLVDAEPSPGTGKSTTSGYSGLHGFVSNFLPTVSGADRVPLTVEKLHMTTEALAGSWVVPDGATSAIFGGFRHAALIDGGRFKLTHPGASSNLPTVYYGVRVYEGMRAASNFVIALPWDGATPVVSVYRHRTSGGDTLLRPESQHFTSGEAVLCTAATGADRAAKIAAVAASATGALFYQDIANNSVIVRHVPLAESSGMVADYAALPQTNPEKTNRTHVIGIWST